MIERLSVKNFKCWADLPALEFGKVTALFGANSSGKTSLIQLLLMLKQTAASRDRRVLNFGGAPQDYVDLGGYEDIVYGRKLTRDISFQLTWNQPHRTRSSILRNLRQITLGVTFGYVGDTVVIKRLSYDAEPGPTEQPSLPFDAKGEEEPFDIVIQRLDDGKYCAKSRLFSSGKLDPDEKLEPLGFYMIPPLPIVPRERSSSVRPPELWFRSLSRSFEESLDWIYYLGPLREYPHRDYRWSGEKPLSVGARGEQAVQAMLSKLVSEQSHDLVESANHWLKRFGLADQIDLRPIARGTRLYEFIVRTSSYKHEANIMDVGFGVSQVLPIIVLAHFAPPDSLLILEQPEIHLHPQVQTELADLFLEVALKRNVQFLVESHSEYLLMRLQRRLAERKGTFADLSDKDVRLYFCKREAEASVLEPLEIDRFGRIKNWPKDFFGDAVAERRAMTEAMLERQLGN